MVGFIHEVKEVRVSISMEVITALIKNFKRNRKYSNDLY